MRSGVLHADLVVECVFVGPVQCDSPFLSACQKSALWVRYAGEGGSYPAEVMMGVAGACLDGLGRESFRCG